jgi:hypothetical protein
MSKAANADRGDMNEAKRPAWWYADEETFMRHLVEPEEDRRRTRMTPWRGGFRWFRSPKVICFEKYARAAGRKREADGTAT